MITDNFIKTDHLPPDEEVNTKNPDSDDLLCIICLFNMKKVLFKPCKHVCACTGCSKRIIDTKGTCPLCRN